MNWVDPSGFEPAPDVGSSADAAIYSYPTGCPECGRGGSEPGYNPLGTADAYGNLTTSPDIAGMAAFPSGGFAGAETMPAGVGSWSPGSGQTGDVMPSAGTSGYNEVSSSIEFSQLGAPTGPAGQSAQLAAGPAVVIVGGLAACLASLPCKVGLVFAGILAFEGLKKATEAIVQASADSTSGSEKEVKKAEQALRTNKDFRRWFHREYKPGAVSKDVDRLNPDLDPEEILEAYQEWLASGSPTVK